MRALLRAIVLLLVALPSKAAVYDRAITTFSPDGKLMQVAYAEEAVKRGSLAVAASNGRDAIVLCIERPATNEHSEDDTDEDTDDDIDKVFDENPDGGQGTPAAPAPTTAAAASDTRRASGREGRDADHADDVERPRRPRRHGGGVREPGAGVGIVDSANNQDRKLCEIDEGIYLAFAGISADGRVLSSKMRLECQSYRYSMGAAPSVGYVARYVGGLQHRYTRTGGARPYGVACLVAGFDEDTLLPCLFRSEPSGAFAEWTASAVGKASEKALKKLESVPDLGALDWQGTAEASVRAALAGGAESCDVFVLRLKDEDGSMEKKVESAGSEGEARARGGDSPRPSSPPATTAVDTRGQHERGAADNEMGGRQTAGAGGRGAWGAAGWRDRGGIAVSKWFLGSVGGDGEVRLEVEEEKEEEEEEEERRKGCTLDHA